MGWEGRVSGHASGGLKAVSVCVRQGGKGQQVGGRGARRARGQHQLAPPPPPPARGACLRALGGDDRLSSLVLWGGLLGLQGISSSRVCVGGGGEGGRVSGGRVSAVQAVIVVTKAVQAVRAPPTHPHPMRARLDAAVQAVRVVTKAVQDAAAARGPALAAAAPLLHVSHWRGGGAGVEGVGGGGGGGWRGFAARRGHPPAHPSTHTHTHSPSLPTHPTHPRPA